MCSIIFFLSSLIIEPWAPVLILSKDTFSFWTTEGTIFIDNSTLDQPDSQTLHVCSNGPSSISRSITFSQSQREYIDEDYTEIKITGWSKGKIIANKYPNCGKRTLKINTILDSINNDTITWNSFNSHYVLCSKNDIRIDIMFYNDMACVKDVKIAIWKIPSYEYEYESFEI